MRIPILVLLGGSVFFALYGCGSDSGGGGTGGAAGTATGGAAGTATGGQGGGGTGGTGGTGGASGSSAGGSAGSGSCSILSGAGCAPLWTCAKANCDAELVACYGSNYQNDDGTGSLCEVVWSCSQTCNCGDTNCLLSTCYPQASADCKTCIGTYSDCLNTNCSAELQGC